MLGDTTLFLQNEYDAQIIENQKYEKLKKLNQDRLEALKRNATDYIPEITKDFIKANNSIIYIKK